MRDLVSKGLSVYDVDADRLRALAPDLIITQMQCDVCAVTTTAVEQAVAQWLEQRPVILSLMPNALHDLWGDMRRVAAALGVVRTGETLIAASRQRLEVLTVMTRQRARRPRTLFLEWIDPLIGGGHWMPELVTLAGGVDLFGVVGGAAPQLTWPAIVAADPDVIVVAPCGFSVERTRQEMIPLCAVRDWRQLRAVQEGEVYLLDGNQYFNRPGPRIVDSAEILAEVLHPDCCQFGHSTEIERWPLL